MEFRAVRVPIRNVRCCNGVPASERLTALDLRRYQYLASEDGVTEVDLVKKRRDSRFVQKSTIVVIESLVGIDKLAINDPRNRQRLGRKDIQRLFEIGDVFRIEQT